MQNHYYNSLIAEIKPLLDEQGFTETEQGRFQNEKKAIKIEYDQSAQMYRLFMADIPEEGEPDFVEVSSWLFDDTQNESDAASVGMDFCDTVREKLGVKIERKVGAQIDMPTFNKDGDYNMTAFAKKMLDLFGELKEPYRAHVSKYGNFLYIDFFGTYLVPQFRAVYAENSKKTVKKVTDVIENAYVEGDRDVVNILVATLSAAVAGDENAKANLFAALGENTHFIQAITAFIPNITKSKKLKEGLLK